MFCFAAAVVVDGVGTLLAVKALAQEKRAGDAKADKDRIGFAEEFDTIDGWEANNIASMEAKNGIVPSDI